MLGHRRLTAFIERRRERWRRRHTERLLASLPPELRKDIGWPGPWRDRADGKR